MEAGAGFRRRGPCGPAARSDALSAAFTASLRSRGSCPRLGWTGCSFRPQIRADSERVCVETAAGTRRQPRAGDPSICSSCRAPPAPPGPRGSDPSVVRPRLPPAEPSESQELLSAQPPCSHSAQATWLRRVIFQNVDNVLRLLVPSAAHSRRPGSFAGRDSGARQERPGMRRRVLLLPPLWTMSPSILKAPLLE